MSDSSRPLAKVTDVDPDGDVQVFFTKSPQLATRASSKVMSLASPVWRATFSPKFREGMVLARDGALTYEVDDDAAAMMIILNALHHRNHEVPSDVNVVLLHAIALLADMYDLSQALLPWSDNWIRKLQPTFLTSPGYEKWLCISSVFNVPQMFAQVRYKLLLVATVDDEGEMVTPEGNRFSEGVRDSIITGMRNKRDTLAKRLSDGLLAVFERYKKASKAQKSLCSIHSPITTFSPFSGPQGSQTQAWIASQKLCDSAVVGALTLCLLRSGLWDLHGLGVDSDRCPLKLYKELKTMENPCSAHIYSWGQLSGRHLTCGLSVQKEILDLAESVEVELNKVLEPHSTLLTP